jgi:PLP dependent protein
MRLSERFDEVIATTQSRKVVAATKYVDAPVIRALFSKGIRQVGENRVQDMLQKQDQLTDIPLEWHFIGRLQTNKVKAMINRIDCLHSLDSLRLAAEIQKHRKGVLPCFVEVHISEEPTKSGVSLEEVEEFVTNLQIYDKIQVIGLMGMAPYTNDTAFIRPAFQTLFRLAKQIQEKRFPHAPCEFLSMGMSNDYLIAIEEGSTHLRLGSILFQSEG